MKISSLRSLLTCTIVLAFATVADATIPQTINYQGQLTSAANAPVNASVSMVFKLYNVPTGGSALWTETQTVAVANGLFNAQLGNVTPFNLPFDVPYYLGVTVGTDAEMTPRQALKSVGSAFQAAAAASLNCTGCVTPAQLAPGVAGVGATGPSGLSSLIAMATEPAGANCAYGGSRITSGLDVNANGVLDASEVTATRYACNGSPFTILPSVPAGCGTAPLALGPTPSFTSQDPDQQASQGGPGVVYAGSIVSAVYPVSNPNTCTGVTITNNYQWALFAKPTGSNAVLSNIYSAQPTFVADVAGVYQLSVQVTDTLGNKSPVGYMTVPTSACGIQPPRILSLVPPAGPLGVGGNASLSAVISLPDNQNNPTGSNYCPIRFSKSFNYSWSIIGAPLGGNGTLSNTISAAPSFNAGTVAGNYVVRLIVTDSAGLSTSATVSVVVSTCAGLASTLSPIVVTATDPQTAMSSPINTGARVSLSTTASVSQYCGSVPISLSYTWSMLSKPLGSGAILTSSTNPVAQFIPDVPGAYQFQVTATDQFGYTSSAQTASVITSSCGLNPVTVSAQATASAPPIGNTVGNPVLVTTATSTALGLVGGSATSNDNQGDPMLANYCPARFATTFTYTWSIVNAPPMSTAQLSNVNGTSTSFLAGAVSGIYQIQVVAKSLSGVTSAPSYVFVQVN